MITVWGRRNSVNVQKVMWTLGELSLPYERLDVGGSFGATAAYLEINPNAVVPTIRDRDFTLYESNACVRYLAREYGQQIFASDSCSTALADQWMDWQTSTLMQAFFLIFLNKIRLPADKSQPAQIERGTRETGKLLQQVEHQLESGKFVIGDKFSTADISIGVLLYRYFTMDIERPSLPNLERYYNLLTERPAYEKHVMIPFGANNTEWNQEEQKNAGIQ